MYGFPTKSFSIRNFIANNVIKENVLPVSYEQREYMALVTAQEPNFKSDKIERECS